MVLYLFEFCDTTYCSFDSKIKLIIQRADSLVSDNEFYILLLGYIGSLCLSVERNKML